MRLKEILPKLVFFQQTTNVKNNCIGEEGRLISGILEMDESLHLKGCIVTVYLEKAFDSLSHLLVFKKY